MKSKIKFIKFTQIWRVARRGGVAWLSVAERSVELRLGGVECGGVILGGFWGCGDWLSGVAFGSLWCGIATTLPKRAFFVWCGVFLGSLWRGVAWRGSL